LKTGEPFEYFGIIVSGECNVQIKSTTVKTLKCGDVIGQMFCADFTSKETSPTTVIARSEGSIAMMIKNEIKNEMKKYPEAYFRIMQVISKVAMETFLFNLKGKEFNPFIRYPAL
jgi:CRP-like cAMP-binding protein